MNRGWHVVIDHCHHYLMTHLLRILRARATLGYCTVRKKCPQVRYVSHVYYAVYILYNDYYFQIIIEVAQLRQHKQRLNDLRTQLG